MKIEKAEAKLSINKTVILRTPVDPNVPYNQPVKWSNNKKWKFIELDFSLKYHTVLPPPPSKEGLTHFVTHFEHDIIKAILQIEHRRNGKFYLSCIKKCGWTNYHIYEWPFMSFAQLYARITTYIYTHIAIIYAFIVVHTLILLFIRVYCCIIRVYCCCIRVYCKSK